MQKQQHAATVGQAASLLNESNIPPEHLPKARAWFQRQMDRCAAKHGDKWPEHREWLADYFNEELRQHLESKGVSA